MLSLAVVVVMVATSFSVVGMAAETAKADALSLIGPQWWRYVSAALQSGEIPEDATPADVKVWLDERVAGMSDKVLPPWTPLKTAKQAPVVDCWGRRYEFGSLLAQVQGSADVSMGIECCTHLAECPAFQQYDFRLRNVAPGELFQQLQRGDALSQLIAAGFDFRRFA